MRLALRLCTALAVAVSAATHLHAQRAVPTPASVLGFEPGTERRLTDWDPIVRYFHALDRASPRVSVR